MALVVLLRGVNVGGHRTFRPTELAKQLQTSMLSISARQAPLSSGNQLRKHDCAPNSQAGFLSMRRS
jgi:uncharacterized protein (DUF1697 family)